MRHLHILRLSQYLIIWFFAVVPVSYGAPQDIPLRFAFAISGGASMGAYEAGLNWGLLTYIRRYPIDDLVLGGQTRPLDIASVAGASAGGINSLLSGLVWCTREEKDGGIVNRVDENIFRDVWLTPDINTLLPGNPDSPLYAIDDGLLSRSDLTKAANGLRNKWKMPAFRADCRLPLGVSVTRVIPEVMIVNNVAVQNQRFIIPFELRVQPDNTIAFYFNPADYLAQQDLSMVVMPYQRSGPEFLIDDETIQDVVLTSAAFPIAFGRMRLKYCRLSDELVVKTEATDDESMVTRDENPLVCPEGYQLVEAEFADGGLFDNIPLGLARKLAENNISSKDNPLPVEYVYIDPDPIRYKQAESTIKTRCESENPPAACQQMEFGLGSQSGLLLGAFGTARKYELFRELASDRWRLNLEVISKGLASKLKESNVQSSCQDELPWFAKELPCYEAMERSSVMLRVAYSHIQTPITEPFSLRKLRQEGLIKKCRQPVQESTVGNHEVCTIEIVEFRRKLAQALYNIYQRSGLELPDIERRIQRSIYSMQNDRLIHVTSRGAPITGTMLGGFAAFLDRKFREYDYYVGVYDATILVASNMCSNFYSPQKQAKEFHQCFDQKVQRIYEILEIEQDPRARYVFSLLARGEYGSKGYLKFSYEPDVPVDTDMQIIHVGLVKSQQLAESALPGTTGLFAVEEGFFDYLNSHSFVPTETKDKKEPLLTNIMDDPEQWSYEFVRRSTTRLSYLEQQAQQIFTEREPDPEKRPETFTGYVGASALLLQTGTYKYPKFSFAPSTAPENWSWRYVIPYELGVDLVDRDLLLTWQPTWSLSVHNTVGLRATLGLAEGLFDRGYTDGETLERENYISLGLDYTYLTGSTGVSGWGVTPTYYHAFNKPQVGKQSALGGDVHVGFIKNRLRIGLGARDYNNIDDTWFLQIGVADIPGLVYWLTR